MGKSSGRKVVWVRLDEAWLEAIEARLIEEQIPPAAPGRVGGPSEWLRRLVARELGKETPCDPHELARGQLTGQPNQHHPALFGRPSGRQAAKLKREAGETEVDDDVAIVQTDWYRDRAPQMTPGKRLRIYRGNAGLTLTRLSELSGIPKGNLSQMEHDKLPLGRMIARKLARHLQCDYRSLL